MKQCSKCKKVQPVEQFSKASKNRSGLSSSCKTCDAARGVSERQRGQIKAWNVELKRLFNEGVRDERVHRFIANRLCAAAKIRAAADQVPYALTPTDVHVPTHCPVLGIKLEIHDKVIGDGSPSLDRLVPALGYVPGNVTVMSMLANRIKGNASVSDIAQVAKWMESREIL